MSVHFHTSAITLKLTSLPREFQAWKLLCRMTFRCPHFFAFAVAAERLSEDYYYLYFQKFSPAIRCDHILVGFLARQAFLEISRLSSGAYSQFDSASVDQLRDLLKAVAIYAAGGLRALQDFSKKSDKAVKLLEQQLKS